MESTTLMEYPKDNPCLRVISGNTLVIKRLDGDRLICEAGDTFPAYVDEYFIQTGDKRGAATAETPVQVLEIIRNSFPISVFRALPGTWNQKWLSQSQITEFCKTLPEWLLMGNFGTIFLAKEDENEPIDDDDEMTEDQYFEKNNVFLVYVYVCSNVLSAVKGDVHVDSFMHDYAKERVVVPIIPSLLS